MILRGKNAMLTGASRGIGSYIAGALAELGVNLVLTARTTKDLEKVASDIPKHGNKILVIPADITVEKDRINLLKRTKAEFGEIDILVNNAGIVHWAKFERQPYQDMIRIIETNLMAPLYLTREILPGMIKRGQGHVVNVGSLAGKKGVPFEAVYSASKAAIIEWSGAIRMELEGTGIGVSVVSPIYVSKVGVFAKHCIPAPKLAGSVSPEKVAKAVVNCIVKNKQEILVRPTPTRPLLALNVLWPQLGNLIVKAMGTVKLNRRLIEPCEKE